MHAFIPAVTCANNQGLTNLCGSVIFYIKRPGVDSGNIKGRGT